MPESILSYLPNAADRKPYRLQTSLTLEEAAQLEAFLVNPSLPFQGDMSHLIRTFIRAGISQLLNEQNDPDSAVTAARTLLTSDFARWSSATCDQLAVSAADQLGINLKAGNTERASAVVHNVVSLLDSIGGSPAKALLLNSLTQRGFTSALERLRASLIDEDKSIYWLDSLIADVFA